MALEYKAMPFALVELDRVEDLPAWNPRAEVPVLMDGDTVICNSPDILAYLDRVQPERPLYPQAAREYATVRQWERMADSMLDPIVSVIATWKFANLPAMPDALLVAAKDEIKDYFDLLEAQLAGHWFICGDVSAADFATYPHVAAAMAVGLGTTDADHPNLIQWLNAFRQSPQGQSDLAAVRRWWATRGSRTVDTDRINWGTFRLEWLLAHGQAQWFAELVRQDRVLWSVGPNNNALRSPASPKRSR